VIYHSYFSRSYSITLHRYSVETGNFNRRDFYRLTPPPFIRVFQTEWRGYGVTLDWNIQ